MGSVGGQGEEESQILPVLLGTLPGHQVQHHDSSQNSVLHRQPDSAMRRHLLGHTSSVLHSGQLRREDYHGYHDPQFSQHLPAAGRRDQPAHVARHAPHRKVSTLHHGSGHVLHHSDGLRVEYTFPVAVDPRDVALGPGTVPQSSTSTALHAAAAR